MNRRILQRGRGLCVATVMLVLALGVPGCAHVPVQGVSAVSTTGQDLNTLAAQATQAYVDYKAGNANYAWAVSQALQAYQTIAKTNTDVKALVKAWTGDGTFAEKLARIFAASNAPPEAKMAAIANGVTAGAANSGP